MTAQQNDHDIVPIQSRPLEEGDALVCEQARQIYAYWKKIAGQDPIPQKADFDVLEVQEISPEMLILDLVKPGLDFKFRLVGTELTARLGIDPTDDLISDFPLNEFWSTAIELCRRVAIERRAYWYPPLGSTYPDKSFLTVEAVILPLLDDFGDISQIVSVMHFND